MTNKICRNCKFYKILYRKPWYKYFREQLRYCTLHKKLIKGENSCDCWKKIKIKFILSSKRLNQAEKDIIAIFKHLDET